PLQESGAGLGRDPRQRGRLGAPDRLHAAHGERDDPLARAPGRRLTSVAVLREGRLALFEKARRLRLGTRAVVGPGCVPDASLAARARDVVVAAAEGWRHSRAGHEIAALARSDARRLERL